MRCDQQSYLVPNGVGNGTTPSNHRRKQELLCAAIAQLALGRRSKARQRFNMTSAWLIFFPPVTNKNFFLMSHFKTVCVCSGKKHNLKIFLRNSLLVRQKKPLNAVRDCSACTVELINSQGYKWMGFLVSFVYVPPSLMYFLLKHISEISKHTIPFSVCVSETQGNEDHFQKLPV